MNLATLEPRLENWARAARSGGYSPGRATSAEGMYRGGGWREVRAAPIPPDFTDAALVSEAWRRCMPFDKDVLQMHYIWRAPASFICRRLKLKQGRGHEHIWTFALYHAQQEIDKRLDIIAEPVISAYNPRQMTESVD